MPASILLARIDSTIPQSAQAAPVGRGSAEAAPSGPSRLESAVGIQPIMVAMPMMLNTISAIAAISIRG
jgi:hypothetical protein